MSQDIFDNIDPTSTSGTELATLLNEFKDAVASGFSGDTARPTNLQTYGYWIKYNDPDNGLLSFMLYDGTQDIELFQINKSTATIILSNSEDEFNIVKNSDDAIGPDLGMKKGRVTGDQTLTSDVLGNIKWIGRDGSAVEYTQAQITTTALEDVTSGAHGANIAFYVTQTGTSSLVKAITISDEKKLGIGVDDPTMMVETFDTSANAGYKATIAQDSTSGPSMTLHKKRVTTNGQVLTGDTIGNFKLQSTDNAGAEIPAGNIKAVAAEDHLATQGGTNIVIERVKLGEVALSTAMTIDDSGVTIHDDLTVSGDMTYTGNQTMPADLTVTGDLTVNGTTTTVNTETLDVEDANITINNNGTDITSEGAGLTIERTGTDGSIVYEDALTSKFKLGAAGSEVEVADVSSTQTFTNKTQSGGTVTGASQESPTRADVKKDTEANLITYAATAADGQMCFATDTQKMYQIIDNDLEDVGGGGVGNTETIAILDGEDDIADWDTSGLTNATLVINSTTPLNGDNDYKFGNVTGSTGEIAWSPNQLVPLKSQSSTNLLGVDLAGSYEGDDNDLKLHFYDVTNSEYLESVFVKAGDGLRYELLGYADSTASIKWGIEVIQVNDGKFFHFVDVQFKKVVYPMVSTIETQAYNITQIVTSLSSTTGKAQFNQGTATINGEVDTLITAFNNTTDSRTDFTALKSVDDVTFVASAPVGAGFGVGIWLNNESVASTLGTRVGGTQTSQATWTGSLAVGEYLTIGRCAGDGVLNGNLSSTTDFVKVHFTATRKTDSVVVSNDDADRTEDAFFIGITGVGSTNTAIPVYTTEHKNTTGNTISIQNTASDGLSIHVLKDCWISSTQMVRSNGNSGGTSSGYSLNSTQLTTNIDSITLTDILFQMRHDTATTETNISSINRKFSAGDIIRPHMWASNSSQHNANSTLSIIATPDIVPKLLALPQSKQNDFSARIAVNGATTVTSTNGDFLATDSWTSAGITVYTFKSGIFTVPPAVNITINDAGNARKVQASAITTTGFTVTSTDNAGNYIDQNFTMTVSKQSPDYTPPGVYVGKVDPYQTAYLEDRKTLGTSGGSAVAGTQTRTLNTVYGDTSIVSLSSNQFTLNQGSYKIKFHAPAYAVNGHASYLYDVDNSVNVKDGSNEYCWASANSGNTSSGETNLTISVSTTYELRHAIQTALASDGLGAVANITGRNNEIYSRVEITKLS